MTEQDRKRRLFRERQKAQALDRQQESEAMNVEREKQRAAIADGEERHFKHPAKGRWS